MKRVAVLGSTGMAGHVITAYLKEHGYDMYTASRSEKNGPQSKQLSADDFEGLSTWLQDIKPDVIINCIGVLQRQAEERPDVAILINSYLPQWLANRFRSTTTKVIHLSTDCVFSGKRGGYMETDEPDGVTIYDRSKALGEINNHKDLTFRMSIIGPDRHEAGTGLFHWFMGQHGEILGYSNVIWNGVTTIELARAIDAAIKQDLSGLYQLTPENAIDKYRLLLLFRDTFQKKDITIAPYDGIRIDKTLINTRKDFAFDIQPYYQQIQDMKNWIAEHRLFYGNRYHVDDMLS